MTIHLKIETTSRGDLSGTTCSYDSSSLVSDVLKVFFFLCVFCDSFFFLCCDSFFFVRVCVWCFGK